MSGAARKWIVVVALLSVSAAMVYGTWLAVDDLRAKPMAARVTIIEGGDVPALEVVNTSDFAWLNVAVTVNGTFTAGTVIDGPIDSGAVLELPLSTFVDDGGRTLLQAQEPVREVAGTATRVSRFPTFNVNRPTSGRWPLE